MSGPSPGIAVLARCRGIAVLAVAVALPFWPVAVHCRLGRCLALPSDPSSGMPSGRRRGIAVWAVAWPCRCPL